MQKTMCAMTACTGTVSPVKQDGSMGKLFFNRDMGGAKNTTLQEQNLLETSDWSVDSPSRKQPP